MIFNVTYYLELQSATNFFKNTIDVSLQSAIWYSILGVETKYSHRIVDGLDQCGDDTCQFLSTSFYVELDTTLRYLKMFICWTC
jgi:hypothetical protein